MNEKKTIGYSSQHDVISFTSKRYEFSPYRERYPNQDITYGLYSDRFYPLVVADEDLLADYWSLRKGAMLYDVPEKPMEFIGPDSTKLLEKLFTRKISDLKPFRARYALACTHAGTVLMDGVLMKLSDDHFWYVKASGEFDAWVRANQYGLNVTYQDSKSWVLQVQGPKALEVLKRASDEGLSDDFGYFHVGWFRFAGQKVLVSRTGWTGEQGFEIYSQPGTDHLDLWDHVLACGDSVGLRFGSVGSMGIRRMEAGILDNGVDVDQSLNPYQVGLGSFVDLEKSDFIGRQALLSASKRLQIFGIRSEGDSLFAGLELRSEGQIVGKVISGGWSPTLERGIGYMRLSKCTEKNVKWSDCHLTYSDSSGLEQECVVLELPFFDKEKLLPRGLASPEAYLSN